MPQQAIDEIFQFIDESYKHADRHYHTGHHIEQCLNQLDKTSGIDEFSDSLRQQAEVAIWMHDVIYVPGANDNEELSAAYWERVAHGKATQSTVQSVALAIRETTHKKSPSTPLASLVVDLDLSGMGLSSEKFRSDGEDVRRELAYLSDTEYVNGQIRFFEALLARDSIYHTEHFYNLYEQSARENIRIQLDEYKSAN